MKKKCKTPSNPLQFNQTFTKAAKLLEGKSAVMDNIMASMGDGLSIQDLDMRIVYQNKFMIDNFGPHIGKHCYKIYERRDEVCKDCPIIEAYKTGKTVKALRVCTTKEEEKFRYENIASVLRNDGGEIVAGMGLVRFVEDRERVLDELRVAMEQLKLAKAVYECSSEGIMVMDQDNRIISVNSAFEHITGYSYDEVAGAKPSILNSGRHTAKFYADMLRSLQETGTWRGEIWNKRKDGRIYCQFTNIDTIRNDDGEVSKRVCVFYDATEKKLAEERINYMAQHDSLTELPNRILFTDRMRQALTVAQRNKSHTALLYIDLDYFKLVNDAHGHEMGDALLKSVAERMIDYVRKSDTVSRIGGDEFTVLLPTVYSRQDAVMIAEKICKGLEKPFIIQGKRLEISCSIGCAVYPDDGQDDITLMHSADRAMYKAKERGRNRVCCEKL